MPIIVSGSGIVRLDTVYLVLPGVAIKATRQTWEWWLAGQSTIHSCWTRCRLRLSATSSDCCWTSQNRQSRAWAGRSRTTYCTAQWPYSQTIIHVPLTRLHIRSTYVCKFYRDVYANRSQVSSARHPRLQLRAARLARRRRRELASSRSTGQVLRTDARWPAHPSSQTHRATALLQLIRYWSNGLTAQLFRTLHRATKLMILSCL